MFAGTQSISSRDPQKFFTEEPHSKYLHSSGVKRPLSQLFSSGLGADKQPSLTSKQMGVAVSQAGSPHTNKRPWPGLAHQLESSASGATWEHRPQ